jgi:hypothetical protein
MCGLQETVARLVERQRLPRPGQGPSEDQRQAAWFQFTVVAEARDGSRAAAKMARWVWRLALLARSLAAVSLLLAGGGPWGRNRATTKHFNVLAASEQTKSGGNTTNEQTNE